MKQNIAPFNHPQSLNQLLRRVILMMYSNQLVVQLVDQSPLSGSRYTRLMKQLDHPKKV